MKAVVLEIIDDYVVVMKDDGTIVKIKNDNYFIGGEIEMKENKVSLKTKLSTLVAALLIFAMIGTGTWANASKGYEVIVEGKDKEIIIEVNRSKDILKIDLGDYDEELEDYDFEGMDIIEALRIIINELEIDSDEIFLTAVAKDDEKAEKFAAQIRARIENNEDGKNEVAKEEKKIEKRKEKEEDKVITNGVGYEKVQAARDLNITPGKYNLITRHLEIDPENDREMKKYIKMSNQEIMKIYSSQKGEKNGWVLNEDDELVNRGQDKDKDKVKDKDKDKVKDNNRDKDKVKENNKDKDKVKDNNRDKDKVKEEEKVKYKVRDEDKIRDEDKDKVKDNNKDKVNENSSENKSNQNKEKESNNNGYGNSNGNKNK